MEAFEAFKKELEDAGFSPVINMDSDVNYIVTKLYPAFFQIVAKHEPLFEEEGHVLMGLQLSDVLKSEKVPKDVFWKHIIAIVYASLGYGDFKSKIGPLIAVARQYLFLTEQDETEFGKAVNDDKAEDHFKEIIDFISTTRIFKICLGMAENFDIKEFGINLENPEESIKEIGKNAENHPAIKKILEKFKKILSEKIERGEIAPNQIQSEIESIKVKITSIFGKMFLSALGGGNAGITSADMMGNSPEARRQRMVARLQKKQREKNSQ